jgi:hypothetical protein
MVRSIVYRRVVHSVPKSRLSLQALWAHHLQRVCCSRVLIPSTLVALRISSRKAADKNERSHSAESLR